MNVNLGAGIKNRFTFVVEDIETKEKREYTAHNIVLDAMWSRLVNFQSFFVNIHFGTGTGAFNDRTRTGLYTFLGTKAATTEFQTRALPTSTWRRKIVLNPEEYVGQTITEVGVAYGSSAANLVTHAAPKDAEGNPISIGPKKDTEIITIYADMYFVLAENMYGGKIKWVTPLANNELLTYLMGGNYPTQQFRVGQGMSDCDGTVLTSLGQSTNILVANWIKDTVNKKATTPVPALTVRLGASVGNGEIHEFGLGSSNGMGTFRGQLPIPNITSAFQISESIGVGDGETMGFNLKWNNPKNLVVKIDDATAEPQSYEVSPVIKSRNILRQLLFKQLSGEPMTGTYGNIANLTNGNTSDRRVNLGDKSVYVDVGEEYKITKVSQFRFYLAYSSSAQFYVTLYGADNQDLSDKTIILPRTQMTASVGLKSYNIDSPVAYRYYIVECDGSTTNFGATEIELIAASDQITFLTPPPAGAVITADYTVDYIPKDEFHVLDLQAAIQYGEVI